MGKSKTTPLSVERAQRRAQALKMRASGSTFQEIADALYSGHRPNAHRAVTSSLEATVKEPAEQLRALEAERLDAAHRAIWPKIEALAAAGADADTVVTRDGLQAVATMIRLQERRARLFGLDAPTGPQLEAAGNGQIQVVLDGRVMEKTRSAVELEVPADESS